MKKTIASQIFDKPVVKFVLARGVKNDIFTEDKRFKYTYFDVVVVNIQMAQMPLIDSLLDMMVEPIANNYLHCYNHFRHQSFVVS